MIASGQWNMYWGIYPFTSITKDQTPKAWSLGITCKCVSLLDIGKTLSTMYIVPACCCEIPRNLSCQSSYFWWKLVGLFFLQFPGWKWNICRDQSRLTFSSHRPANRLPVRTEKKKLARAEQKNSESKAIRAGTGVQAHRKPVCRLNFFYCY